MMPLGVTRQMTPRFNAIVEMMRLYGVGGRDLPPTSLWTATTVGSASGGVVPVRGWTMNVGTVEEASSRIYYAIAGGLNLADANPYRVDFSKRLALLLVIKRLTSNAQLTAYAGIKQTNAHGALGEIGFGISIANLTLAADSYKTALNHLSGSMATMTSDLSYRVLIVHSPATPAVTFYLNGVLSGSITAAAGVPTAGTADAYFYMSAGKSSGTTEAGLDVSKIMYVQEE